MYLTKIEASFKDNPKMFSSYYKAILHPRSTINSVITFNVNNLTATSLKEKAELFNTYFYSVFRPAKSTEITEAPLSLPTSALLSDFSISEEEVAEHLSNLDPSETPGQILKQCSSVIAPCLCSLFNHSIQSGTLPSELKSANVTPVHKKNKKEPAINYRPISLLSIISKVLERCVCHRFFEHVQDKINKSQQGFFHGHSCVTQLLATLQHIGHVLFLDLLKPSFPLN
ncbi:Hypothetical predicted protein [Paramuricea clavata]|uniref:Uncharacterized protein n=1 Tax=Paramuricea clavata TaxID=317549 RepID=A0A7D9HV07_PARCT|nr:Hypothetical predicted protein [Paramuricea clavata]